VGRIRGQILGENRIYDPVFSFKLLIRKRIMKVKKIKAIRRITAKIKKLILRTKVRIIAVLITVMDKIKSKGIKVIITTAAMKKKAIQIRTRATTTESTTTGIRTLIKAVTIKGIMVFI
jgi:hypothetical protein